VAAENYGIMRFIICNRRPISLGRSNEGAHAGRGKVSHVTENINAYIDLWENRKDEKHLETEIYG
jgi:hypothetical protein